eukprot:g5748.t1
MPRRKSSTSRVVKMLEEDEEMHDEIVNHDVYTHTVSSIEEDVAFRHSTVEQDVRRWHHEHELPVRRSRSKKNSSRKSAKSPAKQKASSMSAKSSAQQKASNIKAEKKVAYKRSGTTASSNNEGSQLYKLFMEHLNDPIVQAYIVLLIPALLYALTNMYFPGTRSEPNLPSSSSETTNGGSGSDMIGNE